MHHVHGPSSMATWIRLRQKMEGLQNELMVKSGTGIDVEQMFSGPLATTEVLN